MPQQTIHGIHLCRHREECVSKSVNNVHQVITQCALCYVRYRWCYGTLITVRIKQNRGLFNGSTYVCNFFAIFTIEKMGWIVHGKTELHAPEAHKTLSFPMQNPSISNHLKPPMKMHKSSQTSIVNLQSVHTTYHFFFVKKENYLVVNIPR